MSKPFSKVHVFGLRCQWHEISLHAQPSIFFSKEELGRFYVVLVFTVGGDILGAGAKN